jgi:dUTP pyrophosphatase
MLIDVKIKLTSPLARIPQYAKEGDAGADVYSIEEVLIPNGTTRIVDLGFSIQLRPGFEMQVRSRSGNASKGLVIANAPGTIDSGYRGPCKAIMHNQSGGDWLVKVGDKIAQFVIKEAPQARYIQVDELESSDRGAGGFGSTGK